MKNFTLVVALFATVLSLPAQSVFYSQDFSGATLPSGWTNIDKTGNNPTAGVWKRFNSSEFESTTYDNGYWVFLSDAQTDDGLPEDAELTSGAINCSAQSKVFLQAQHWFDTYFANNTNSRASILVSSDSTNWNEVYSTTATTDNAEALAIDITTYAANQNKVYLRFKFTGSWDGLWAVDDISLINPPALDAAVEKVTIPLYIAPSSQVVSGTFSNQGSTTINQVQLAYTINGGTPVTETFNGLSVQPFQSQTFTFSAPATFTNVQSYTIAVTVSSPNGGTDLVSANNTKSANCVVLSHFPTRNVVLEEFTTAPCQFCPDAATRINQILSNNTGLIGVGLHDGFGTDAMTTPDHTTLADAYTDGAPAAMIDRVYYEEEGAVSVGFYNDPYDKWQPFALARKAELTPVSIAATNVYNSGTRELTVDLAATFYSAISDDYRVNCYIVEDSVSGSGSGYNQSNASNGDNTSEWYQKGNPIIGYKHRNVARYMFGGAWGTASVVPATTTDGGVYNKQYTYTLPSGWNDSRIKLVVLVQHYNANDKFDRQILNAMEFDLNSSGNSGAVISSITEEKGTAIGSANLYPNPANDFINIEYSLSTNADFSMEVYNLLGQPVKNFPVVNLGEGDYKTRINTDEFNNGVYFVVMKDSNKAVKTLKFVVNK
jgi:hypothetical protein